MDIKKEKNKKTDDLFQGYTDDIFGTQNKKDTTIDNSEQKQPIMDDYLNFVYNGSKVTQDYHFSIMKQAQMLLVAFTILFILVTIFICVIICVLVFKKDTSFSEVLIPLIISGVSDLFSGILIIVMQNLLKSRDNYFKESVKSEHFSKIIGLIQTMNDDDGKVKMIEKIVDNYCNLSK